MKGENNVNKLIKGGDENACEVKNELSCDLINPKVLWMMNVETQPSWLSEQIQFKIKL